MHLGSTSGTLLKLLLAPFVFFCRFLSRAALWGAWLLLVLATLVSLSAGVVLCIGGYLVTGLIVICVTLSVEWGLI
ncbi:MAG: hypothetical protein JW909_11435 [Planctomycetes bacterium]|nr:hypothetical protein [Planctomycetota bacterium]